MTHNSGPPTPRVPPLTPAEWGSDERAALARFSEPLSKIGLDGDTEALAKLPNVLTTLLRNPALAGAYFPFAHYLQQGSRLDGRSRELLILRTGWLRRSEYEWAQHVQIGQRAGLSEDEIRRVAQGPDAPGWTRGESLLLSAADQLVQQAQIDDATWEALSETLDREQMMELVFTVGGYDLAAMAFNSFGLQLDPGLRGFDETS